MYTDNLRNKLVDHINNTKCSLYRIEQDTGVHRHCIKKFLSGNGVTYETGMKLKKFVKDNMKKVFFDSEGKEHKPTCIHFPCTCDIEE